MSSAPERRRLVLRLDHKLRSALLLVRESAARSGSGEVVERVEEAMRRASALAAAAVPASEEPRRLVLASAVSAALQRAEVEGDAAAAVSASETALRLLLRQVAAWLGPDLRIRIVADGGWVEAAVEAAGPLPESEVPEMGEPLIRLLVEEDLGGKLEVPRPGRAVVRLPSA